MEKRNDSFIEIKKMQEKTKQYLIPISSSYCIAPKTTELHHSQSKLHKIQRKMKKRMEMKK